MIRFIDLRNQGTGNTFAFWNTITDKFIEFKDGDQAWYSFTDFIESAGPNTDITRFKNLSPEWLFNTEIKKPPVKEASSY